MKPIAYIRTDFPEKFGLPRQSSLVDELKGRIVFEKEYQKEEAFRGLEGFSHIWLLWEFQNDRGDTESFRPMVRPPKLGGNTRVGVFATRSPFRPNPIGLSCVRLERIEFSTRGVELYVSGIDMRDMTPIYDIKPYIPYADCHPEASTGFLDYTSSNKLEVIIEEEMLLMLPVDKRQALINALREDPRTAYVTDPERVFGLSFAGCNVSFTVSEAGVLRVTKIEKRLFGGKDND